jgi:membrane protein DedA with SNARE-associated domain
MVETILELVRDNAPLAYATVALMCFGESFAFLSLLVPGWAFMLAAGALVANGTLHWLPVVLAGALGATLGDAISYWIGLKFKHAVPKIWPFTRHPDWLKRGHDFFERWGVASVFLGRFFGPVRAVIPLAAGMMEMPARAFWIANVTSAVLSAALWTAQGALVGWGIKELHWESPQVQAVLWSALALGIVGYLLVRRWRAQRR